MRSARSASAAVDAPKLAELAGGALDGFNDGRKGVAEDHGAPGAEVVDVAVAVGVGEVRAGSCSMNGGAPPTARKARTGELTPPGKKRSARC